MGRAALLCLLALLLAAEGWASSEILTMKDLETEMTTKLTGSRACVRKLTADGEVGCAVPGDGIVSAPIMHMTSMDEPLTDGRAVLVSMDLAPRLLDGVLHSDNLKEHVKAVLIAQTGQNPSNFSMGDSFPSAGFPQPASDTYVWNPWGTGLRLERFEIPIFLLSRDLTEDAIRKAERNARQGFTGAVHVARMSLKMLGEGNSRHCIEQKRCQPIGGHSVLAALPDSVPATEEKPIVLAIAHMDTAALFTDRAVGADSRLSSLLALLAAVDLLHEAGPLEGAPRRVVVAALSGDVWDYMGSRRLLWELGPEGSPFANNSVPVNLSRIAQVVELGSLGGPDMVDGAPRIFLHHPDDPGRRSATIEAAFRASAEEMVGQHKVIVENAAGTPGLPPSSLKSFLLEAQGMQGAFAAEFNATYTNRFFESYLDDVSNVDAAAIAAASVLVARTLHRLAFDGEAPALEIDDARATNMTNQLVDCLAKPEPSLRCPLAADLISLRSQDATSSGEAEHYLGTLPTLSVDPQDQDPAAKSNLERFVYNYLAVRTGLVGPGDPCNNKGKRCARGQGLVCAGYRFGVRGDAGLGRCVRSDVFFVPSYSLLLSCKNCSAAEYAREEVKINRWALTSGEEKAAVDSWMEARNLSADPMWTEADWPVSNPQLEMFLREDRSTEMAVLVAGLALTVGSAVAALAAQLVIDKHWKRS